MFLKLLASVVWNKLIKEKKHTYINSTSHIIDECILKEMKTTLVFIDFLQYNFISNRLTDILLKKSKTLNKFDVKKIIF